MESSFVRLKRVAFGKMETALSSVKFLESTSLSKGGAIVEARNRPRRNPTSTFDHDVCKFSHIGVGSGIWNGRWRTRGANTGLFFRDEEISHS